MNGASIATLAVFFVATVFSYAVPLRPFIILGVVVGLLWAAAVVLIRHRPLVAVFIISIFWGLFGRRRW